MPESAEELVPDFDSDQAGRLQTERPSSVLPAGEGLAVRGLTKTFGSTIALDHMDAAFTRGTVHGLIGENGSGKSTFVNVVAGAHRADLGQVTLDGAAIATSGGASNPAAGKIQVACVYQDGSLIAELTVGQNLDLIVGPEFRPGDRDGKSWRRALLDDFGLTEVDLSSRVADIPINEQRLVEIAAALARRPDVALFDESTAALDERGVARVLDSMRSAAAAGVCVIFVTHRLHEVLAVAADITVLRDGRVVGEVATGGASTDELVRLMAGREVAAFARREAPEAVEGAPVLQAGDLRARGLGPVQVTVRRGEIVGIGGAAGNGQSELVRALSGAGIAGGEVRVDGSRLHRPEQAVDLGAVFVSGDRRTESLSSLLSVRENYTLAGRATTEHWWSWLPRRREIPEATRLADQFDLARTSIEQPVSSLSGGNQQKVAIGRAIARRPAVLLVEEPTAGVDVRSRLSIYRALTDAAGHGTAVVFTSSDASELRMLADRVLVLARGRQVAELAGEQVNEEAIVHAFSTAADRHEAASAAQGRLRGRRSGLLRQLTWSPATFALVAVLLLALGAYATVQDSQFAAMGNVSSILQLALPLTLVAIAEMPVLLVGEIDASLGSMMGLIVVLLSFQPHTPVAVLCLTAVGAGFACGLVNALLVIGMRINSVIATIATLGAFLGLGEILRPTPAGVMSLQLSEAVNKAVAQIPVVFIAAVVLAIVIDIYINATRTGLRARAVGYSAERAAQLGVRSRAFKAAMFLAAGLLTGLAGVVLAAQTGVGDPSVGSTYTLLALAVPVIGGAILAGGRGSALGCVLGALFVAEVEDFVPFINLPNGGYLIAVGVLTVLALIVGSWRSGPSRASAISRIVSLRK
jgi:ribose transport system ATP-binding protein